MRISEIFKLEKTQAELDFVDIDLETDLSLFIDPHFLANRTDRWSQDATRTIRSFFQQLITLLHQDEIEEARALFANLGEPNETCLGLSKKAPQGRGVGPGDTNNIFESIRGSRAIQTGCVEDLEDFVIFVENFSKDKLSDMTTNIIRKHLIDYTQDQCKLWDINLTPQVQSGPFWDRQLNSWNNDYTDMLVINDSRYLLVPKCIVSYMIDYTPQKFHTHFILNFLQQEHLRLNSVLVQRRILKDGSEKVYVTKKSIRESESPGTKQDLNNFVQKHPKIFKNFKEAQKKPSQSLSNNDFYELNEVDVAAHLRSSLTSIGHGATNADLYHNHIMGVLEFLFYPELVCPQKEKEIHQGRKRIDITFDNAARDGIFKELSNEVPCQFIFVECKNYKADPNNPELDQLSGRFSPNRGKVGLLVCRSIENIDTFYERCKDTCKDDRGLILPITDQDIIAALDQVIDEKEIRFSEMLRDRRRTIQMS